MGHDSGLELGEAVGDGQIRAHHLRGSHPCLAVPPPLPILGKLTHRDRIMVRRSHQRASRTSAASPPSAAARRPQRNAERAEKQAQIELAIVGDEFSAEVAELKARRKKNLGMGGPEKIAKQKERGKLTVRERLGLLFDKDTFVELGLLAHQQPVRGGEFDADGTPADGVITGHGNVDGRQVWVIGYDFTCMPGSPRTTWEARRCTAMSLVPATTRSRTTPSASPRCAGSSPTFPPATPSPLRTMTPAIHTIGW